MIEQNPCHFCQEKGCSLYGFGIMDYFCVSCFNKTLELNKCEVSLDMEKCNKHFEKYQWLSEMSSTEEGFFGFIYNVYNKTLSKQTVLKVQRYVKNIDDNEIKISCLVSDLHNFVKLLNYWICDIEPIDDIWKTSHGRKLIIEESIIEETNKIYYLEMEKYEGTLRNLIDNKTWLTNHDKISMVFELFNGLDNAYTQFGFHHGDEHLGNMFYSFNNTPREYTITIKNNNNNKTTHLLVKCKSIFYPVWGDFGESKINKKKEQNFPLLILGIMEDLGFNEMDISKQIYNLTNKQCLIWLGQQVNYTDINKKQKIKNDK
jgi:hypothetical protein